MKSSAKRKLPYVIAGCAVLAFAVFAVLFIIDPLKIKSEPEVTEPTQKIYNADGSPYYEDVAVNAYKTENCKSDDSGRIYYDDENVKYYTGIDVSQYQGDIDWDAVASDGISFAIIRVGARGYGTSGKLIEDANFRQNLENAEKAGLKVGAYFYSQATSVEEAEEEADYLLSLIKGYKITAPVVFDWENMPDTAMRTDSVTGETLDKCAVAFCEKIKNAGYTPLIYFNLSDGYTRYDLSKIKDYSFWYAQYEGTSPKFYYKYDIWQYSCTGSVKGIEGNVDLNIAFTDFSQ